MDWRDHIHRDPAILAGKPVIKGTRISVAMVLEMLSGDWTIDLMLNEFPSIPDAESIRACLAFAAEVLPTEAAPLRHAS